MKKDKKAKRGTTK